VPRKQQRVRVERGLYKIGRDYWACATRLGATRAEWLKIGPVGIQEARRGRDAFAFKLKSGQIATTARRVTVRQIAEDWFADLEELRAAGELRPRTIESYANGINRHVLPTLGSRPVASIGPDDLTRWHEAQRRAGAAPWTIRARWVPLRGLLAYAARTGQIVANPADLLIRRERPKLGRPKGRFLTPAEIEGLTASANGVGTVVIPLLLFTGLRAAEALGLTWEDVDLEQRTIHVRFQMSRRGERVPLKTEAGRRDVILMEGVAHRLRKHRLATRFSTDRDLVIVNGVGRTLGYSRFRKAFAGAKDVAGLDDVTPHTCRHTFASILIDQGCDVEFVSQQLGHASTKTTWDLYVHLFRAREHADAARRDLDAAFGRMLKATDDGGAIG
jgi:integrase